MKYLLTGGAGFAGSAIAHQLLAQQHTVWIIDNLSTGYLSNLPPGATFIKGDCSKEATIRELQGEVFDAILHIAGQSSGEISFEDPVYDINCNTVSTLLLLQYAVATDCKRFMYASTMSVYGQQVDTECFSEKDPANPLSFYAVGKLASEAYLKIYAANYGIHFTALRYFNIYGPGQNLANLKQGMISIYLKQLVDPSYQKITIKGSTNRFRDFIYIDDVVSVTIQLLHQENAFNQVVNVGTGKKTTIAQLLALLQKHTAIEKPTDHQPGTPGDQFGIYADNSFLKTLMDISFVPVDTGIRLFIDSII